MTGYKLCNKCLVDYLLARFDNNLEDLKKFLDHRAKEKIIEELEKEPLKKEI